MQNQQDYTPVQKTQPLVTFIVTCYNLPVSMLCKCIDSILALSLQPSEREIIIVDDGSDESPLTQLQKYQDNIILNSVVVTHMMCMVGVRVVKVIVDVIIGIQSYRKLFLDVNITRL